MGDSAAPGLARHTLHEGPIFQRECCGSGALSCGFDAAVSLVGDAAHTVPPTGAKGMNLAVADVVVLARALDALRDQTIDRLLGNEEVCRIWKAQHFSWWMTEMLHAAPDATDFDRSGRWAELRSCGQSERGGCCSAEGIRAGRLSLTRRYGTFVENR